MESNPATTLTGRFAPSPTGALHFGSLLAAMASYCDIRSRNGTWQLRIDDIDGPRSVAGSAESIQRSLENFGFEWDGPILWQSTRLERYQAILQQLIERGLIFACCCSRRSLPQGQVYPGHCREHRIAQTPVLDHALRQRMRGQIHFADTIQGLQQFDLEADVGDSIVWRRDGLVSYSLACAVDDAEQASHVVRGADLLESTGAQLAIIKALNLTEPTYAHIPVAIDINGDKLSKHSQARPIDDTPPIHLLQQAWQFLGQTPLEAGTLAEFWALALHHWQLNRVPATRKLAEPITQ